MAGNLTKKTFSGFLWLGGVKATNAVLQFGILAVLARLLTPSEFGLMGIALVVVSFSDIFTDIGFGPAITQKKELSKIDIHTGFTSSLIFGLLLFIILWSSSPLIAGFFKNDQLIPILKAISIVLWLRAITTVPLGLMFREMQFKKLSLIQITSYAIGYGFVGIVLAYKGYGVWSLVYGVISQTILLLILFLFFSKEFIGFKINKKSFYSLLHFGGGYSLSKVFSYVANKGDKILVGKLLGVDALGLYERGYQIVKYISSLMGEVIDKVLFSPIARKQEDRKLVGKVFLDLTYLLAIIFFPLTGFIYFNAKPIVHILLGEQWDSTINVVKIMAPSVFFLISTRIGSTVAKSLGDVYRRAWRTLFYGIFVITSVYFTSSWGIGAVSIAVTVGTVFNYLLAFHQVKSLTKVAVLDFLNHHMLGIILLLIFSLMSFLMNKYIDIDSNLIRMLFQGLLLIFTYSLILLFDRKGIVKKYKKMW